jgi:RNA polymerase primary sigma factor
MSYEAALCVQRLKRLGQQQGFLTFMQVNDALPSEIVDPEKIEAIVGQLTRAGIRVLENAPSEGEK